MTWWDKLKAIAKREAAAVKEEAGKAATALDEALAKKERELNATPAERVDMLVDEIEQEEARFGELEGRLRAEGAARAAEAGIEPPVPAATAASDEADAAQSERVRGIRETLTVSSTESTGPADRTSHVVSLDGHVLASLGEAGLDATVADIQFDVMVLDARRRGDHIALRTPTLSDDAVADLVAAAVARHLSPSDAPPAAEPPGGAGDAP